MEETTGEFEALMRQVRAGDREAAERVYARYCDPVRRVVRRHLEERLRRQYDSNDFVQSVWASFFHVPPETYTFPNADALVAFLSRLAYNKVVSATRKRLGTLRRGEARERSLDAPAGPDVPGPLGDALPAPTATPSQYVQADDRWEALIRDLPPGHRKIVKLLRLGYTHEEVAALVGKDRKVIQRLLDRLQELATPP